MQLVAPDILEAASGLSLPLAAAGFVIGALLWFIGGLGHRFWVVLGATLIAGVVGLRLGPVAGMQPLVAGLLLAVAVGSLALALFRILLFVASGLALAWLAGAAVPSWDEPIACFLAGGLLGLALYRVCVAALTSFGGTLLMGYSGLCLAATLGQVDVVALAEKHGPLLNWAVGAVTVLGLLVQFLIQRRGRSAVPLAEADEEEEERRPGSGKKPDRKPSWWGRVTRGVRRAG